MQGLHVKQSKKVGCKAKITVRVRRDKPQEAEIEIKGSHNHDMDRRHRRMHPAMRKYAARFPVFKC